MAAHRSPNPMDTPDLVTLLVTMVAKPECEQAFLDLAAQTAKHVHEHEPRTVLYVLTKDQAKAHTYVWIERYRGQDALDTHTQKPYMTEALRQLPELLAEPPEVAQLTQVVPE